MLLIHIWIPTCDAQLMMKRGTCYRPLAVRPVYTKGSIQNKKKDGEQRLSLYRLCADGMRKSTKAGTRVQGRVQSATPPPTGET